MLLQGKVDYYWKKVGGERLSPEFKDLILSMFSYDPTKRPTIEQLKNHPWMQKPFSQKLARTQLLDTLQEKRANKTADCSREEANSRGAMQDPLFEFVRQTSESELEIYKFNDLTDHDITVPPAAIWEQLQIFNDDFYESKLKLEQNLDKKCFILEDDNLKIKVKFLELNHQKSGDEEPKRLRLRFIKKRGDRQEWYTLFNQMKELAFEDFLLATKTQQ